MRRMLALALLTALGGLQTGPAAADAYPSRTVSVVVPLPPGG